MVTRTRQQDIVALLKQDHDQLKSILGQLADATGHKAKALVRRLKQELDVHTGIEEQIVYPAFRRSVGSKEAKVLVQESLTEHGLVDRVMAAMAGLPASSAEFQGKAIVLKELVEHHIKDEEKEMFPKLRAECGKDRLLKLARQVEARKAEIAGGPSGEGNVDSSMTRQELYDIASKKGVKGRSGMDKRQLLKALR